jgi:SAM-dependent MidA family methyltransferase
MPLQDSHLPVPAPEALAASERLAARIRDEIARAGGWIGFDRYMRHALYEPGLGYYSGGSAKLGAAGDFTTGPELGPLLPRALGTFFAGLAGTLGEPVLLELGAGSGALAAGLLDTFAGLGYPDARYEILETSAELRSRQHSRLARFGGRVRWLDRLPEPGGTRILLANEVADALPVARFVKARGRTLPLGVASTNDGFQWCLGREDPELTAAVRALESELGTPLPDGYRSELCLELPGFVAALARVLERGVAMLIDYGVTRREYYHAERGDGTLICHYRHRAHTDPFLYPGLQDISSWVDFSACAEAAAAAGLEVLGFTTQGLFLAETIGSGALAAFPALTAAELNAAKTLLLPGEMGERFKILLLGRDVAAHLPGRDFRSRF